jgi:hypothetical protein
MKNKVFLVLFVLATGLIGLNIAGLFTSLRSNEIYSIKDKHWDAECPTGISLTEDEFHTRLEQIFANTTLSDSARVTQTCDLVEQGLLHYWLDDKRKEYHLTIPAYENYILWGMQFFNPLMFEKYQLLNWRKTIQRGVAICSQAAIALSEILNEKGIESQIVKLNGHVVARARIGTNRYFIVDPDFGITLPYDLDEIQNNVELIRPYYQEKVCDESDMKNLTDVYNPDGNKIVKNAAVYMEGYGTFGEISYWLIWIIPLFLILPFASSILKSRRQKK